MSKIVSKEKYRAKDDKQTRNVRRIQNYGESQGIKGWRTKLKADRIFYVGVRDLNFLRKTLLLVILLQSDDRRMAVLAAILLESTRQILHEILRYTLPPEVKFCRYFRRVVFRLKIPTYMPYTSSSLSKDKKITTFEHNLNLEINVRKIDFPASQKGMAMPKKLFRRFTMEVALIGGRNFFRIGRSVPHEIL
uniref:Uncharacterized protein n=1 Tax=Romanomermis culicivorax TaxID=13658 RepID=A0A915L8N9_ROMCU